MNNALATIASATTLTMSSREIAEYTGKHHHHVLADIRIMLEQLEIAATEFRLGYLDANGQERTGFKLPKDLTITLVSGYSAPMRFAIVKRWMELEAQAPTQLKVPTNFREALLLAAAQQEQLEEAHAQLAIAAPKVEVFDTLIADKNMTLQDYVRTLPGVKQTTIARDLIRLGYLYKTKEGNKTRVYAKHLHKAFTESVEDTYGHRIIRVLESGKLLLNALYRQNQLTFTKAYRA